MNCDIRNGIHQIIADADTLFFNGTVRIKLSRFSEIDRSQIGSQIHGHKGDLFSGLLIIDTCHIHKSFLKLMDNLVVFIIAFWIDDDMVPFAQLLNRFAERGEQSHRKQF